MLERIANPNKPPMGLRQIQNYRSEFAEAQTEDEEKELKTKLVMMEDTFRHGRGTLTDLSPKLLGAIDKCFVDNFIVDGEPVASLFYPHSADGLNLFSKYFKEVD